MSTIANYPQTLLDQHSRWHMNDPSQGGRRTPMGQAGSGLEFLTFHRTFIANFHAWYDSQPNADLDAVAAWTAIPQELKTPRTRWTPVVAAQENRIVNNFPAFASADELSIYIENGIHNQWLHSAAGIIYQEPNLFDPMTSPLSTYFYKIHGLIDHWWSQWQARQPQPRRFTQPIQPTSLGFTESLPGKLADKHKDFDKINKDIDKFSTMDKPHKEFMKESKEKESIKDTLKELIKEDIKEAKDKEAIKEVKDKETIKEVKDKEVIKESKDKEDIKESKDKEMIKEVKEKEIKEKEIKEIKEIKEAKEVKDKEVLEKPRFKETKDINDVKVNKDIDSPILPGPPGPGDPNDPNPMIAPIETIPNIENIAVGAPFIEPDERPDVANSALKDVTKEENKQ